MGSTNVGPVSCREFADSNGDDHGHPTLVKIMKMMTMMMVLLTAITVIMINDDHSDDDDEDDDGSYDDPFAGHVQDDDDWL